jgi:hypothetical protein
LKQAVAHYLGYGLASANWSSDQQTIIDMAIKAGLRMFYAPPQVYQNEPAHGWRFLSPIDTITTIATYATGTVEVSNNVCAISGGIWPAWAATNGILTIDGTEYPISSRVDGQYLAVSGADVAAGAEYSLAHNGDYTLPDDYGSIDGNLVYARSEYKADVMVVGESKIRHLRANDYRTGWPVFAAVRPKSSTGAGGQRFEIQFWPIPDAVYVLSYRKLAIPNMLTDQYPYPIGGALHGETILAACLAAAEQQENDTRGVKWESFLEKLRTSIQVDLKQNKIEHFGYNGDGSDGVEESRHRQSSTNLVRYVGS